MCLVSAPPRPTILYSSVGLVYGLHSCLTRIEQTCSLANQCRSLYIPSRTSIGLRDAQTKVDDAWWLARLPRLPNNTAIYYFSFISFVLFIKGFLSTWAGLHQRTEHRTAGSTGWLDKMPTMYELRTAKLFWSLNTRQGRAAVRAVKS